MKKLPPIAKVYEAYSAIADHRVEMHPQFAYVKSSDATKTYTVKFQGNEYSSNDHATVWQHYGGYPILAVLMLQNKLPLDQTLLPFFEHINWNKWNAQYHHQYDEVLKVFFADKKEHATQIESSMRCCLNAYDALDITIKGNRAKFI